MMLLTREQVQLPSLYSATAACIFRGKVARTVNLSWAGVVAFSLHHDLRIP